MRCQMRYVMSAAAYLGFGLLTSAALQFKYPPEPEARVQAVLVPMVLWPCFVLLWWRDEL